MEYVIFDIDGTLADCQHRIRHIDGKMDWKHFLAPQKVSEDTPIEGTFALLEICQRMGHRVHFVSGRPEALRPVTEKWLVKHSQFMYITNLHMRKDGDFRADHIVKEEILDKLLKAYNIKPLFVVDDRPSVLAMWQRRGIHTFAVPSDEKETLLPNNGILSILIGPSGAGKSTWAAYEACFDDVEIPLVGADRMELVHVSSDNLRLSICGNKSDQSRNAEVFDTAHALIKAHLAAGHSVIFDATNLKRANRLAVVSLAQGGPVNYFVFDRPNKAPWHGNMDVVRRHEQTFKSQLKDIMSGDNLPNVTVYDRRTP